MDHRIEEILVRIENELSQPLNIHNLAASVNLSVSHLQHLFKNEVRTSIVKYTKNLRLEKARLLLETTHCCIKEIRLLVGAGNESHFMNEFKRKFGLTPTSYRKTFRHRRNGQ